MKELPVRKSIRLKGYDYSNAGYYFVTICVEDGHEILSEIVGADDPVRPSVELTDMGKIIDDCWHKINDIYENVYTDKYCIMPNHFHGIIVVKEMGEHQISTGGQGRPPLQKILQGFKSTTTRYCYKYGFRTIWQRSYYDEIIRNEEAYRNIWRYIDENPAKWAEDECFMKK